MDDDNIVVSGEFLDSFCEDLRKAHADLVLCLKEQFVKDIPNLKKVWLSRCDSCDKTGDDCPLCVITRLVSHLDCILSGDVYEWN